MLESVLVMYGIPYGDYFRVEGRWEVSSGTTANTCKLVIYGSVYFMKKTWFKNNIVTASMKEQKDSFLMWVQLARKEISKSAGEKAAEKDAKRASTDQPSVAAAPLNLGNSTDSEKNLMLKPSPRRRLSISLRSSLAGFGSLDVVAYAGTLDTFLDTICRSHSCIYCSMVMLKTITPRHPNACVVNHAECPHF